MVFLYNARGDIFKVKVSAGAKVGAKVRAFAAAKVGVTIPAAIAPSSKLPPPALEASPPAIIVIAPWV
jgi:hypothetical protein